SLIVIPPMPTTSVNVIISSQRPVVCVKANVQHATPRPQRILPLITELEGKCYPSNPYEDS
ncbi:hypothetical protein L9F63_005046, partial [Diploptera punctata]